MAFQLNTTINGIPCPEAFAKVMEITTSRRPAHIHTVLFQVWYNRAAFDGGDNPIYGREIEMPYDPTAEASFATIYAYAKANDPYWAGATDVLE